MKVPSSGEPVEKSTNWKPEDGEDEGQSPPESAKSWDDKTNALWRQAERLLREVRPQMHYAFADYNAKNGLTSQTIKYVLPFIIVDADGKQDGPMQWALVEGPQPHDAVRPAWLHGLDLSVGVWRLDGVVGRPYEGVVVNRKGRKLHGRRKAKPAKYLRFKSTWHMNKWRHENEAAVPFEVVQKELGV